ncbi:hypothetical protein [Kocuria sp. HSID16901]|uniref:hypothetical protein n=1 Tax=Kocuria sp. HSID16901 TaxID=2419505 RepID=UPI000F85F822|nr:hypothetical protein [Kocuria sp. HSID16901]RUQ19831.1 hypothetical protein D8M21_10950 [Kocuria sp. HSID16901]
MVTTTNVQRLPHPLWSSKATGVLWLSDFLLRLAIITCGVLMLTALAQVIGDIDHMNRNIPEEPARNAELLFVGFVVCAILCRIVRRELRFRSPGALISAPALQPISLPDVLRMALLTSFSLWLVSTQLPLDLPLLTAFWRALGFAGVVLGVVELIRDSILDRRRWAMNLISGLRQIGEGLILVILSRPWYADPGLFQGVLMLCAVTWGVVLVARTVSMIHGRRSGEPGPFSPVRAVDEASEGLTQLVVDRYDSGATLKTRDQWRRWIRVGLVTVAVVMITFFIISLYTG